MYKHEITSKEQQENSDRVIKNMEKFSAEAVSDLDYPYNEVIIKQLNNYTTDTLLPSEKTAFKKYITRRFK